MKGINALNDKNIKRILQPYHSNEDANVIDGSGSVESQTDPISTIQDLVLTLQTEMKTGITMMNYKFDDLSKNVKALKLKLDTMRANSMKRIEGFDKSMMDVLETPVLKQQETNGAVHLCPINMFKNKGLVNTKYHIHDCADLRRLYGEEKSGFYRITTWRKTVHTVYCDMETDNGGWMVFQRRYDGSENFFRGWNDYKHGFGDYSGEFWSGNQVLYEVTSSFPHFELRIEMEDFGGEKRFAKFSEFSVNSEADRYLLRIGTYSGDAGTFLLIADSSKQEFIRRNCIRENN
ncbi:hypothetical protein FSP39_012858 [Pinctada imbricata]|uniref:Fibrinogen C-terminal domain-containing protein n=1 Tax=Pinctada imbricata TaxID=66713 RepID=A0AA88YNL7_PINIB|nr:hypothetical protein FSP39_012858 [Pinctada imbricata]